MIFFFGSCIVGAIVIYYQEKKNGTSHRSNCTVTQNRYAASTLPTKQKKKKHTGRCDGDCANCPPHYGYRHGRWYYGHSHIEGCVFGGNKGDGGRD